MLPLIPSLPFKKTAKEGANKVNTLNVLCKQFRNTGDYERARRKTDDAFVLAKKLNFKNGIASSYNNKRYYYYYYIFI